MLYQPSNEVWAVTTPDQWNRSLLLFDRVWLPPIFWTEGINASMTFSDPDLDDAALQGHSGDMSDYMAYVAKDHGGIPWKNKPSGPSFFKGAIRSIARQYSYAGNTVIPLYGTDAAFEHEFPKGVQTAYCGALKAISVVCPNSLSFSQVIDFRNDAEAVRKYRALRLWLRDGLQAGSVTEATDRILAKLDAYEWSIRKHGLKTINGALSAVLDSKTFVTATAGAGLAHVVGGPLWAALAGGAIVSSRCSVWLAERKIELEDIKRGPNSEVALFYEMKSKFPTASPHV